MAMEVKRGCWRASEARRHRGHAPNLPDGQGESAGGRGRRHSAVLEVKNLKDASRKSTRIGIACFNNSGKIIGGGVDFPQLIPANGRVLVEASVMTDGKPDSCEVYATPSPF